MSATCRPRTARSITDHEFEMNWEVASDSQKHVRAIADALKADPTLILATDPDREGEAISWHLQEALTKRRALKKDTPVSRVVFNAITKTAVTEAMAEPAPGRHGAGRGLPRPPRARLPCRLQPLARCCGASCPAPSRRAGCSRSACASSSSARWRSRRSAPANTGPSRRCSPRPAARNTRRA